MENAGFRVNTDLAKRESGPRVFPRAGHLFIDACSVRAAVFSSREFAVVVVVVAAEKKGEA